MSKYASIDIGSNTLLLLIVEEKNGELTSLVSECDFGRLGQGLSKGDHLSEESIQRSLGFLKHYRSLLDAHEVQGLRCVGTQALREAVNRDAFVTPAEAILGTPIEIISGDREAELVAKAVIESFPAPCKQETVIVDVGGGSTECIHIKNNAIVSLKSIPIGAVRLSEQYLQTDPPTTIEISNLCRGIEEALATLDLPKAIPIIGTAGTSTAIASMHLELERYDSKRIHGHTLSAAHVQTLSKTLLRSTLLQKKSRAGLEEQRADIIAGGVAIYAQLLSHLEATHFLVCDQGVRWGLIYELRS